MKRQPPIFQSGQSTCPCPRPDTACSVMQATSMPRALMCASASCAAPSASPEMRLWLCRSEWTRDSDPPRREEREAPLEPTSPPSVRPRAGLMARPPVTAAIILRKLRRSSVLTPTVGFATRSVTSLWTSQTCNAAGPRRLGDLLDVGVLLFGGANRLPESALVRELHVRAARLVPQARAGRKRRGYIEPRDHRQHQERGPAGRVRDGDVRGPIGHSVFEGPDRLRPVRRRDGHPDRS